MNRGRHKSSRKSVGASRPVRAAAARGERKVRGRVIAKEESVNRPGGGRAPRFRLVAIGASAGGLEALTELFTHLPPKPGMAFVVTQHLDPHRTSTLPALLGRVTGMPVIEAQPEARLGPDRVYVTLPNTVTNEAPLREKAASPGSGIQAQADRLLLSRFCPAGVVINQRLQVLQFRGRTGPFLEHSQGAANLNLLEMVREGIARELQAGINTAMRSKKRVKKEGVPVKLEGASSLINIEIIPFVLPQSPENYYLVTFEPPAPSASRSSRHAPNRKQDRGKDNSEIQTRLREEPEQLRAELLVTRDTLQSIIEEQEATNDELENANSNLHNLLVSVDVPVVMVAPDLRIRQFTFGDIDVLKKYADQMRQGKEFAKALIETVREPLIVLDSELRIAFANPSFYKMFKVAAVDANKRRIYELDGGGWNIPRLRELLEQILPGKRRQVDFRLEHDFARIGRKEVRIHARQIEYASENLILLAMTAVKDLS